MSTEINGWILDDFIAPGAHLKQGDLIKFDDETNLLRKAGIVVTADCDLEQRKHAKLVTLVPVVSVTVLMENYFLPEDCERKKEQIETHAFKIFGIDRNQESETKKALLREIVQSPPAGCDDASILAAKIAADQLYSLSVNEYKSLMNAMKIDVKKPSALTQQIIGRGDLLILPDPKLLGIGGSVAWVRHIWQVSLGSIALRTSEVNYKVGERIARLDSPYRYRLTQLMAQVFSDIGLPSIPHSIEQGIQEAYDHA